MEAMGKFVEKSLKIGTWSIHRHPSRVVRAYLDCCQREVGRYLASV
jgi:hypothetical protein